jgi:hypothetical protein
MQGHHLTPSCVSPSKGGSRRNVSASGKQCWLSEPITVLSPDKNRFACNRDGGSTQGSTRQWKRPVWLTPLPSRCLSIRQSYSLFLALPVRICCVLAGMRGGRRVGCGTRDGSNWGQPEMMRDRLPFAVVPQLSPGPHHHFGTCVLLLQAAPLHVTERLPERSENQAEKSSELTMRAHDQSGRLIYKSNLALFLHKGR